MNATSALLVMSLGVEHGQTVTVASENVAAVNTIADLIEKDLDAE